MDKNAWSPAGSGWRNLIHYAQIIKAKSFVRYDYGTTENINKYGQATPPQYNLSKVRVKMAIAHGDLDMLADPTDVAWLLDKNKSGLDTSLISWQKMLHFGHCSFMMARDMSYLDELIHFIRSV